MLDAQCRYVDNRDLGEERLHENTNYRILYLVLHSQTIVDQMTHDISLIPPSLVQQGHSQLDAVVGGTLPRPGEYIMESGISHLQEIKDQMVGVWALV